MTLSRAARTSAWTFLAFALGATAAEAASPSDAPLTSSTGRLKYKGDRLAPGTLLRFAASNLMDGAPAGEVLAYVATKTRLEVVTSGSGDAGALGVTFEMAWKSFTPTEVVATRYRRDGSRARVFTATASPSDRTFSVQVENADPLLAGAAAGTRSLVAYRHEPTLVLAPDASVVGVLLRFFSEPDKEIEVGIVSPAKDGAALAYRGKATLRYVEDVSRNDVVCRKYRLFGPGLAGAEAFLWCNREKWHLEDAELPLAPIGLTDVKLELRGVESLGDGAWETRKAAFVRGG